jgi:osmotically-inducible protein OsmY
MTITERVQEVFNKFNVNLTVTEAPRTEMAEAALENGTVIYTDAEAFAEGVEAYIINDEGEKIPLPPGDYTLADGRMVVVGEGGVVSSVTEAPEEEAPAEEPAQEVEASEEVTEEVEVEAEEEEKPAYVTKEEVEEMIKAALESIEDKEEMSAVNPEAPKAEKVVEEIVEEVAETEAALELAALKAELEDMKKQAAEAGLKHKAPSVRHEPLDLSKLTLTERVAALHNKFSSK